MQYTQDNTSWTFGKYYDIRSYILQIGFSLVLKFFTLRESGVVSAYLSN